MMSPEPLSFDAVQARLDAAFMDCSIDEPSPFDDRRHLRVKGLSCEPELKGALKVLLPDEDDWLIHDYGETVSGGTAAFSIYSDD